MTAKNAIILLFSLILSGCSMQKDSFDSSIKYNNMKITSSAFADNKMIPLDYTCDGGDVNPPLEMSDIPTSTQSLVLIVDDPDAPMGTWLHWTVWNIDPEDAAIKEASVPFGALEGMTDFGRTGWGGPCPPSGTHRYFFKAYALDAKLDLPESAKLTELKKAMEGHILATAHIIGLYKRNK